MTTELAASPPVSGGLVGNSAIAISAAVSDTRVVRGLREQVGQLQARVRSHETYHQLVAEICQAHDLRAAAHVAAGELQRQLGGTRVAIGLRRLLRTNVQLVGLSDVARFSTRSDLVRKLEAAMDEAVFQRELIAWPSDGSDGSRIHHAHRQLSSALDNATIVTVPIMDRAGDCWGAVVVVGAELPESLDTFHEFAAGAAVPLGAALVMWRRTTGWRLRRALGNANNRRRWSMVLAALAVACGILCLPVPYRISADCDVQPVTRRYVVAPFDGSLEESFVAPGDRVSAGQKLARLDGRDIRCDLATTHADYQRVSKERDTALANGQTATAQIARLEMEGLQLKIQLLRQREQELDVASPVDGIVISGDWERARGARLTVGQSLFEIGPLDRMVVEIAVPEDDIHYARVGAPVQLQVNAVAGVTWSGNIEKIHPRAEIKDDVNVFVAEVTLDNADAALLPGMKGTAKVQGPTRTLGWNLLHRPWYAMRRWLGV